MKHILYIILCLSGVIMKAQTGPSGMKDNNTRDALKFSLNESGTHYFQATFCNQLWLRYNESNPGTRVNGEDAMQTVDIGLRRTRMQLLGQITDKVFLYFQFGQNNFNAMYNSTSNRKNATFLHDAVCEYKVSSGNQLKIGGGLTIANGLSRFSQPAISSIMTMDVPVFAQATTDQTDQFSRKLSIYARGQVSKLDYRILLSDPFPVSSNGTVPSAPNQYSNFAVHGAKKQVQTYLIWQFFEHENHTTPYMTGTYLGRKKIFNIGLGATGQKRAMWNRPTVTDSVQYQHLLLLCAESFLDMPLSREKGTAISAYAGFFITNYGTNYLRHNGSMNPANSTALNSSNSISGQGPVYGNTFPMFGSGHVFYTQVGYLLPEGFMKNGRLMPYLSATVAQFDRLQGRPMNLYNAGINWLIKGHNAKITADWQSRPTYFLDNNSSVQTGSRKNCFIIQYQIFI